eukprot:evm.model.scf_2408.2 EVM.evm.TU.scf_2408.2   scf_2408:14604-21143(+)
MPGAASGRQWAIGCPIAAPAPRAPAGIRSLGLVPCVRRERLRGGSFGIARAWGRQAGREVTPAVPRGKKPKVVVPRRKNERMLSEGVSPLPLPPPGPIRTIGILASGLALVLAMGAAVAKFLSWRAVGRANAQLELVEQQATIWQSRLDESKGEWQDRLDEMRQQLEKDHQENLVTQLDMKDAEFATVLLKTEEGVRKEVEDLYKSKMQDLRDEERTKMEVVEKKAEDASLRERDLKEQLVKSAEKMEAMEADGKARVRRAEKRAEEALASEKALTEQMRETVEQMAVLESDANERVRDAEKRAEEARARERASVEELRRGTEKMKTMKGDEEARLKLAEKRAEDALARERTSSEELRQQFTELQNLQKGLLKREGELDEKMKLYEDRLVAGQQAQGEVKRQRTEMVALRQEIQDLTDIVKQKDEEMASLRSSQSRVTGASQAQTGGTKQAEGIANIVSRGPLLPLKDRTESEATNSIVEAPPGLRQGLEPSEKALDEAVDMEEGSTDAEPPSSATGGEIRIVAAGATVPHILKVDKGGEDAFFVSGAGLGAFGVADGVGGWAADGIDPALYSRTLMGHAASRVEGNGRVLSAIDVVEFAHQSTKVEGTSTAIVAVMKPEGRLEIANIGDSGARVFRGSQCLFSTKVQEHEFNMPYQLGDPDILEAADTPSDAAVDELPLQPGDVVVMGSDGVFDNLWVEDIGKMVSESLALHGGRMGQREAQVLANKIVESAHENAGSAETRTPWAVEAASRTE